MGGVLGHANYDSVNPLQRKISVLQTWFATANFTGLFKLA